MAESKHISIGRLGEEIAVGWLENRGYRIIERNYRKKWGELDIVAQKDDVLHFVEVKAGRWNGSTWPQEGKERYRPEDHMDVRKCARMKRVLQTYLAERRVPEAKDWTVDLVVVLINERTRRANVRLIDNILL